MKRLSKWSVGVFSSLWLATAAFAQAAPQAKPSVESGCTPVAVQCGMDQKPSAQKPVKKTKQVKKVPRAQPQRPNTAKPASGVSVKPAVPTAH